MTILGEYLAAAAVPCRGSRGWRDDVRARRPCRARRWAAWRGRTRLARWLAREHAGAAAGLARAEAGAAAGGRAVLGGGLAGAGGRAGPGGRDRGGQAVAQALADASRGKGFIWLCRAMDQDAALPRQDRWRGRALPRHRS